MKTITIIAPHQDDEILSCTYVMENAVNSGERVIVLFITNGDYFGKKYAEIRCKESLKALLEVGIKKENIFFLGYGDGSIYQLYCSRKDTIIVSNSMQNKTYAPVGFQTFRNIRLKKEADYSKKSLYGDLYEFFTTFKPQKVYLPSKYDVHTDHRGTYYFVKQVLKQLNNKQNYKPLLYTYLIHIKKHFAYWPNRCGTIIKKPIGIHMSKEVWNDRVIVKGTSNYIFKHKLISCFESQKPKAAYGFLYAFAKNEEIFWRCEL